MQGFTISGKNGTYVELEDGRWADSVSEQDGENANVEELLKELTNCGDYPEHCNLSLEELQEYVGAS
jgi:hypothetical protein